MKCKLDENLGGHAAAAALNSAGMDATTVAAQGLRRTADPRLLDICRDEGRCLITLDVELGNPLLYRPRDYAGIILIRIPGRMQRSVLLTCIQQIPPALASQPQGWSIAGRLWVIEPGRIREYQPVDDDIDIP